MDISLQSVHLDNIPQDLIIDGSEGFYGKIFPEKLQFLDELPYPVHTSCRVQDQNKLFLSNVQSTQQIAQAQREFRKVKNKICEQNIQNYAVLPKFFVDHMKVESPGFFDYGLNLPYSHGVLEKCYFGSDLCFIRPSSDDYLVIYLPEKPDDSIKLKWPYSEPILNIQNMNMKNSNNFVIRTRNTIYLLNIDDYFHINVNVRLNCDKGYLHSVLNYVNKSELAFMDTRNKIKLFNLEAKTVVSSYTIQDLQLDSKPRNTKFDYLGENILMIMTDKHIKVLDTRSKEAPRGINIELQDPDTMLNFTLDKSKGYSPNFTYMVSTHSYFVYDLRCTAVDDFIYHNLRSPPCFINYFQEEQTELVTIFSQSQKDKAVFGVTSPYSLPYHLSTLDDTYDSCRSQKSIPAIPHIQERLNYPINGLQVVANDGDISIYSTNTLGELFRQDILLQKQRSEKPIKRMYHWLLDIYEKYDPELNVVRFADASKAFDVETEMNEVDVYNHFEQCCVNEFLEDEQFDDKNLDAEAFLEIWDDEAVIDIKTFQSEPVDTKVEKWMDGANFEIDSELYN